LGLRISDWFHRTNDLDRGRSSWRREAVHRKGGWKADCICGIGKGDLSPLL